MFVFISEFNEAGPSNAHTHTQSETTDTYVQTVQQLEGNLDKNKYYHILKRFKLVQIHLSYTTD